MSLTEITNIDQLTSEQREQISVAVKAFTDIGTLHEQKGITHEELEAIYSIGLGFYRSGNYADAEKVFHCLCLLDHVSSRYWTALGGVRQATRNFAAAREAFKFAMFLDIENLKAVYYCAESNLALGDREAAITLLSQLEKLASKRGEKGAEMLAKARALKATIEGADGAKK